MVQYKNEVWFGYGAFMGGDFETAGGDRQRRPHHQLNVLQR